MNIEFSKEGIRFKRELSELDKFVFRFIDLLEESEIDYVIVSGYVPILLGRTRATEDVDILIDKIEMRKFKDFYNSIYNSNMWILNEIKLEKAYSMLEDGLAIRIAEKNEVIPNIELKFTKEDLDDIALKTRLKVLVNDNQGFISNIELQIAFKFYLGTNKDTEDAMHLHELFKDKLDNKLMKKFAEKLDVVSTMKEYKVL